MKPEQRLANEAESTTREEPDAGLRLTHDQSGGARNPNAEIDWRLVGYVVLVTSILVVLALQFAG